MYTQEDSILLTFQMFVDPNYAGDKALSIQEVFFVFQTIVSTICYSKYQIFIETFAFRAEAIALTTVIEEDKFYLLIIRERATLPTLQPR